MVNWYVDEGLAALDREWKKAHPGAVVYHIGDSNHSTNPDVTQHAPDRGGAKPGDDRGEVDASDFMPGKGGVTEQDLDDLAENLRKSGDKRLLIVIRRQRMFSSYPQNGVAPFTWRPYSGAYHGHTHVSVNDLFDNNQSDWKWENLVARTIQYVTVPGAKLPLLQYGDEDDAQGGWNHVARMQLMSNFQDKTVADIQADGVYGAKTVNKLKAIFGGTGKKLSLDQMRTLYGI